MASLLQGKGTAAHDGSIKRGYFGVSALLDDTGMPSRDYDCLLLSATAHSAALLQLTFW